jgi:hypothetical protein
MIHGDAYPFYCTCTVFRVSLQALLFEGRLPNTSKHVNAQIVLSSVLTILNQYSLQLSRNHLADPIVTRSSQPQQVCCVHL